MSEDAGCERIVERVRTVPDGSVVRWTDDDGHLCATDEQGRELMLFWKWIDVQVPGWEDLLVNWVWTILPVTPVGSATQEPAYTVEVVPDLFATCEVGHTRSVESAIRVTPYAGQQDRDLGPDGRPGRVAWTPEAASDALHLWCLRHAGVAVNFEYDPASDYVSPMAKSMAAALEEARKSETYLLWPGGEGKCAVGVTGPVMDLLLEEFLDESD